ncbi:SAM-dependent methyltransferase [Falsiroseomonas bella]|uniref:site-specific DNA-methyltransferase (adenine-specific) n=2 Tax=Falsiroseomonas bella TaxID=2184016 RepID=A0A317FC17_9PROT|nr:SAM-dependent methyltransferase [Falsiroseomonas bella]
MPSPVRTAAPAAGGSVVELDRAPQRKGRFEALSADKLRGGYYTPEDVAAWMCRWAVRAAYESVLEPSCGDGAFLCSAARRLIELGATSTHAAEQVQGVELLPAEADTARRRLSATTGQESRAAVATADFFEWWTRHGGRRFSAVVGNPPFIRYQSFPEPARSRAMAIMQGLGLRPNKLTNIWVPFVVAAAELLEPGGRMALVVPAELLQVTYAAQLRAFLTERFAHLDVVACNELFFDGAEQEVVLLLAEGALPNRVAGNVCRVAVTEAETVAGLLQAEPSSLLARAENKDVRGDREKWLKYFLTSLEIGLMRELRAHPRIVEFGALAEVDVGIVTGANEFFVLRGSEVATRGLGGLTHPLVSKSAHLRGALLSGDEWEALAGRDERVHLVNIRAGARGRIPASAAAYVAEGEGKGVHEGYKCSIRTPWYHVPALWNPDAFLFRQIHDFPRLVLNGASAASTDTIHRVRSRGVAVTTLVAGAFTHLTAASAEIEGRSYGGGVLELEPTEAERLLVPDGAAMAAALPLAECDVLVRSGRLAAALAENDRLVLRGALGLSEGECRALRGVWTRMQGRRFARGRSSRKRA